MITLPHAFSPDECDTRQAMQAHFKMYYGLKAQTAEKEPSSFEALTEITEGDRYFKEKNLTLAAICYLNALEDALYLYEGFFKIGLCVRAGADKTAIGLAGLKIYQIREGATLAQPDLAALFFREVIALAPHFQDSEYRLQKPPLNPHYALAIYELAQCIGQGTQIFP